jgi:hypothetical protein
MQHGLGQCWSLENLHVSLPCEEWRITSVLLVKKLVLIISCGTCYTIGKEVGDDKWEREREKKKPSHSSQAQTARITKCLGLALMLRESRLLGLTPVAKKSSFLGRT